MPRLGGGFSSPKVAINSSGSPVSRASAKKYNSASQVARGVGKAVKTAAAKRASRTPALRRP